MIKVLLYWNHICVLHKQEKDFLAGLAARLQENGISLEVRYFGLGYPEHLSEYLAKPDAVLPDVIVSADLEVFEDARIFQKLQGSLHPVADWVPLHPGAALNAVWRSRELIPFLSIPLVYFTREPARCNAMALKDWPTLAIGGINNSAGKTITKAVWSRWEKAAAKAFLSRCVVSDMPIGAFQQVRQGLAQTALVPSIYALRADNTETFLHLPAEGPLLIPSYLCVRNTLSEKVSMRVIEGILCKELCDFYATNGDLIVYPQCATAQSKQIQEQYMVPTASWLESLSAEAFYQLYCQAIPTAKDPVSALQMPC